MANRLRSRSKVKPKHPPPPPPEPNPQSLTQTQPESTDQTQSDETLNKNAELPTEGQSGPAEDLYMIPDDEPLYMDPDEIAPPPASPQTPPPSPPPQASVLQPPPVEVNGKQKPDEIGPPVRPPPPPPPPSAVQPPPPVEVNGKQEPHEIGPPVRPPPPASSPPPSVVQENISLVDAGLSLYTLPKQKPARPPLPSSRALRRWASDGTSASLYRPPELRPSLRRQTETESNQPPPEEEQSENLRSGQRNPQQEPQEEPLYVELVEEFQEPEEPLYMDPDELNLPVRKLKPSRPPPPSGASVRYSASPRLLKLRELGASNSYSHPCQKPSLRPQLSLPSNLSMGRTSQQAPLDSSTDEYDTLMEWWNTAKCWEKMRRPENNHQGQEQNTNALVSDARGICLAVRLFECLLFHRGKIFNSHITQLYGLADKLDETNKKAKVAGITGGSVAAATGVVLAPFTFGLSLTATAIGVGVAVHGAKGGSSTITDKWYSSQERKKVEEILQDHKLQMKDVDGCLNFINVGMERLRNFELPDAQGVDDEVVKITRVAQILGRDSGVMVPTSGQHKALQGLAASMDIYFEEQQKLKKGSETKLARKVREMAKQMKSGLDELMQTRNRIRSAMEYAETQR